MNAFSPYYVSQLKPMKADSPKKPKINAFDGNDHKARQACVHLPKTHPTSRADVIRRANSRV